MKKSELQKNIVRAIVFEYIVDNQELAEKFDCNVKTIERARKKYLVRYAVRKTKEKIIEEGNEDYLTYYPNELQLKQFNENLRTLSDTEAYKKAGLPMKGKKPLIMDMFFFGYVIDTRSVPPEFVAWLRKPSDNL